MTIEVTKIGVIVPGYNVAESIKPTLAVLSDDTLARLDEIVVIDNNSQDATLKVLDEIQQWDSRLGKIVTIIRNTHNYGLGGSLKIGFTYFLQRRDISHIMILHSDGQGNSQAIAKRFFDQYELTPDAGLIIASRFHPEADISSYSKLRRIGNIYFNFLTWLLTGHRMSDAGSGIILIRSDVLRRFRYEPLTNSFYFNPQLNVLLYSDPDVKIVEVPLDWADSEVGSHLRAFKYIVDLSKTLLTYRINKILGKPGFGAVFDPAWLSWYPHDIVLSRVRKNDHEKVVATGVS